MWYILLSLVILGIVAAVIGYFRNKRLQKMLERGEITEIPEAAEIPEECCGQHETCERDSLLAAVSKSIEYYDDEELDRFKGIDSRIRRGGSRRVPGSPLYLAGGGSGWLAEELAVTWREPAGCVER